MGEVPGSIPGTARIICVLQTERVSRVEEIEQGICGLVVEYAVAIGVTRVRFPADAFNIRCCLSEAFYKCNGPTSPCYTGNPRNVRTTRCTHRNSQFGSTQPIRKEYLRQLSDSGNSPRMCMCVRVSIVVSISACHADDPGSIPGRGNLSRPTHTNTGLVW